MNQRPPAFSAQLGQSQPAYMRNDERQRDIVDDGIEVQQTANTMTAFEFLRSNDIDKRIIERVLLEPRQRRLSDG